MRTTLLALSTVFALVACSASPNDAAQTASPVSADATGGSFTVIPLQIGGHQFSFSDLSELSTSNSNGFFAVVDSGFTNVIARVDVANKRLVEVYRNTKQEKRPTQLLADDAGLAWQTYDLRQILVADADGSHARTLASFDWIGSPMAMNATDIYVFEKNVLKRVSRKTGTVTTLGKTTGAPSGLQLDGDSVFYVAEYPGTANVLVRQPIDGSAAVEVWRAPDVPFIEFYLANGTVVINDRSGGLQAAPRAGGGKPVVLLNADVDAVGIQGANAFAIASPARNSALRLYEVPVAGGNAVAVLEDTSLTAGTPPLGTSSKFYVIGGEDQDGRHLLEVSPSGAVSKRASADDVLHVHGSAVLTYRRTCTADLTDCFGVYHPK